MISLMTITLFECLKVKAERKSYPQIINDLKNEMLLPKRESLTILVRMKDLLLLAIIADVNLLVL